MVVSLAKPKTAASALTDQIAAARQAGEAAMKRVLGQSTKEILKNVTLADLIAPNAKSDAVKGNANEPGGWLHAPANLELFASADRGLTTVGNLDNIPGKQMERAMAWLVPGTHLLILKGAKAKDLSALPVNRWASASGAWINLFTLLADAGLTVETGWRERYDIAYVEEDSPLYPALVMDLSQPVERRAEPVSKKKSGTAQNNGQQTTEVGKQNVETKRTRKRKSDPEPEQNQQNQEPQTEAPARVVAEQTGTESK